MSEVKVNKISPRTNCGTVTLGDSGDTIALGSGASQTGFGRTGTVDWITTVKVTGDSPITGVDGKGYFLNTTAGTITVNLPAGAAGSILAFKDYAGTWDTNAVTVTPNGSEKIGGIAGSGTLSTERQSVTLIYIDSTQGWLDIHDSTSALAGPVYMVATGGTIATVCTNYKTHTFTGPGTFCVSNAGNAFGSNSVDYLIVGGGAGGGIGYGGGYCGGGGGAGGYRFSAGTVSGCYTAGPAPLAAAALPVSVQGYPIVVGGGGTGTTNPGCTQGGAVAGCSGVNSSAMGLTSAGGGGGAGGSRCGPADAKAGGSGGGGGAASGYPGAAAGYGAAGNTPPVSPPQGNNGGNGPGTANNSGGGGGGAGAVGGNRSDPETGGAGGAGLTSCITASPVARSGGGGGSSSSSGTASGGAGGGGAGARNSPSTNAVAGTTNTGGGGGGGVRYSTGVAGNGGSGIVVIRYKFQ